MGSFSRKSALIHKLSSSFGPAANELGGGDQTRYYLSPRNCQSTSFPVQDDDFRAKEKLWVNEVHAK